MWLISALKLDAKFDLCVRYFRNTLILNYKENADAQVSRIHDSWSDKSIQHDMIRFRVLHQIRVQKKAFWAYVIIQCVFCLFSFWTLLMCHCFQMISTETAINNIDRQLWLTIDCGSENSGLLTLQASQWELLEIRASFCFSSYLLCSILHIYTSLQ